MNAVIELCKIDTITKDSPDDAFVCVGSPEKRCIGSAIKLGKSYRANNIYVLKYSHYSESRGKNLFEMRQLLSNRGHLQEYTIEEAAPIPMFNEIIQDIKNNTDGVKSPCITIDVSTFIKWHLLVFLRALSLSGLIHQCRFLYTEPEDYIIDLFQPLSFGVKEIFPIPLYSGSYNFAKESLLVIMLGYEGDRSMGLLENIDPTECLLLIPKPAYHPEWEGRTEEMNKEIINVIGQSSVEYIDSRNPMLVSNQLNDLLSKPEYSKYNILVSPMGTKPQAIGLYLYWSKNPSNTTLIYSSPLRHNDLFYSKGIGRTWLLTVQ